jgi:hypothetical protein
MWLPTFAQRLESWSQLRAQAAQVESESALHLINAWWFHSPWRAYHLHWDDQPTWPDPWQLLSDNMYCGLARGLGIMYTIAMLDHPEMQDSCLVDTDSDNLVLVAQKKYILNWGPEQVLNINPGPYKVHHSVSLQEIKQQIK